MLSTFPHSQNDNKQVDNARTHYKIRLHEHKILQIWTSRQ